MNIGIDARFWGLEHAGIGRYVMELIDNLEKIDKTNHYTLFVRGKYYHAVPQTKNFVVKVLDVPHYSLSEQWLCAEQFNKANLDLLHVPHFNVPLLYKKPFVVTIHDLLWHERKGLSATTQAPHIYLLKYFGYRLVVNHALKQAKVIIVPSNTIRNVVVTNQHIEKHRVVVTHEAPTKTFFEPIDQERWTEIKRKLQIDSPYVLYVGSAYPHKNIISIVRALQKLKRINTHLELIIVTARDVFLERLINQIEDLDMDKQVKIVGYLPDRTLKEMYAHSVTLIQPSLSEGFGLTGLEAMAASTAVIASKIPIFEEIYKNNSLYINPQKADDIAKNIQILLNNPSKRKKLITSGRNWARNYNWEKLARKTIQIYQSAIKNT